MVALGTLMDGLPEEQRRALTMLSEGRPIREAAVTLGIHRGTLYRWIKADPHFRAAYNTWQMEQRESCRAGLLKCAEQAVARVALRAADDEHLAFKVLKEMGLFRAGPALKTEPRHVEQEIQIEDLEVEARLTARHLKRLMDKMKTRRDIEKLSGDAGKEDKPPPTAPALADETPPCADATARWQDDPVVEAVKSAEGMQLESRESAAARAADTSRAGHAPGTPGMVRAEDADVAAVASEAAPAGAARLSRRVARNDVETRIG